MPSIRDTYMDDYGIFERETRDLEELCKTAQGKELMWVLESAQNANPLIASEIFANLTLGLGYDRLSQTSFIPMQRKDFQGYRRRTLKNLSDRLTMEKQKKNLKISSF